MEIKEYNIISGIQIMICTNKEQARGLEIEYISKQIQLQKRD